MFIIFMTKKIKEFLAEFDRKIVDIFKECKYIELVERTLKLALTNI